MQGCHIQAINEGRVSAYLCRIGAGFPVARLWIKQLEGFGWGNGPLRKTTRSTRILQIYQFNLKPSPNHKQRINFD